MEEDAKEETQIVNEEVVADNAVVAEQQTEDKQERNFRALREEKDKIQGERDAFATRLSQLEANQKAEKPKGMFDGDADDWLTKGEVNERFSNYDQQVMKKVEKLLVSYKHPDAHELITKYGNEIPPRVANVISKSDDLEAAIEAIKLTPSYIRDHAKEHVNAAKTAANASRPKSTLGTGTAGSVGKGSNYRNMSRDDRIQLQNTYMKG